MPADIIIRIIQPNQLVTCDVRRDPNRSWPPCLSGSPWAVDYAPRISRICAFCQGSPRRASNVLARDAQATTPAPAVEKSENVWSECGP